MVQTPMVRPIHSFHNNETSMECPMTPDILIVDDDLTAIQFMSRVLEPAGRRRFATDGETALRLAHQDVPDLLLLDAEMPGMDGFQVCQAMKSDPLLKHVPVIFVTSIADHDYEVIGLHLGADDYITKPIVESRLLARVQAKLRSKALADASRALVALEAVVGMPDRGASEPMPDRQ
jgi:DNA-binding response OmpR family regulator